MKAFDTRKKGDSSKFFAAEVNAWNQAASSNGDINAKVPRSNSNTQNSVMFVKNVSGKDIEQFHVMVIERFIFDPYDPTNQLFADDAFKSQASFNVNIYDEANEDHQDAQIAILQQPIAVGDVGLAMIAGSSQVRVDIKDLSHGYISLVSQSSIPESGSGGQLGVIALQGNIGEGWGYVEILPRPETKQFVFVNSIEKDIINCRELIGDKEGKTIVKVALPYLLRRTPFDGVEFPNNRLRNIRFEYQAYNKRKSFEKDDEEMQDALDTIEAAEAATVAAEKQLEDAVTEPEIEAAEEAVAAALAARIAAGEQFADLEETEEFQEIRDLYLPGDILICIRNVVGFDIKDQSNKPVAWLATNEARWWYKNPEGADVVVPESEEPGNSPGPA